MDDGSDLTAWTALRDEAAFQRIVERHTGLVAAVCRRNLGSGAAADEAVQAVFIVLARRAGTIPNQRALASWLYQVALRVCKDARRAVTRRIRFEQEAVMRAAERHHAADPTPSVWGEVRPHLDKALSSLSAAQRDVVIGHYLEGQPHATVAAQLGISEDAARQRLSYALAKLRAWFARRGTVVGAGILAAGLASEATAREPLLIAACTQAGLHPSSAAGASALASGALGAGAVKSVILVSTVGLVLALGTAVTAHMLAPGSVDPLAVAKDGVTFDARSPTSEQILWSDGCEDLSAWGPEPFGEWPDLPPAAERSTVRSGTQALRLRYRFPDAAPGASKGEQFTANYHSLARPIQLPAGATRLRLWVRRLSAAPQAWLVVRLRDADRAWASDFFHLAAGPDGWQSIDFDLVHPARYWQRGAEETPDADAPPVDAAGVSQLVLIAGGGDFDIVVDDLEVGSAAPGQPPP